MLALIFSSQGDNFPFLIFSTLRGYDAILIKSALLQSVLPQSWVFRVNWLYLCATSAVFFALKSVNISFIHGGGSIGCLPCVILLMSRFKSSQVGPFEGAICATSYTKEFLSCNQNWSFILRTEIIDNYMEHGYTI